ncbi:peptide methionine sulfoxide reductase MsrA/MsrB2 [Striga asiatica]|uniref:Peptide methionine sulfoxide reductase MsrA/MsrB2 n=1 Tax=Striga asiatica TaxID=4170 RepID=A0A5A7PAV4_STRAF|nr:peptide methionine sulfoxide reductase MsrA/MsrB2 [Striga asiatica]
MKKTMRASTCLRVYQLHHPFLLLRRRHEPVVKKKTEKYQNKRIVAARVAKLVNPRWSKFPISLAIEASLVASFFQSSSSIRVSCNCRFQAMCRGAASALAVEIPTWEPLETAACCWPIFVQPSNPRGAVAMWWLWWWSKTGS